MKNYKGLRFGWLTVIGDTERIRDKENRIRYKTKVICDCGKIKNIYICTLNRGLVHSCGEHKELRSHRTHGRIINKKPTRLYRIWSNMKSRCYSSKEIRNIRCYQNRGIKICKEWLNNYINFEEWALRSGYKDNLSIDRIKGDKDYCPDNCRWATRITQNNNKSNNHFLEFDGCRKTLAEWSRDIRCKVSYSLLRKRANIKKWSAKKILLTPSNRQ